MPKILILSGKNVVSPKITGAGIDHMRSGFVDFELDDIPSTATFIRNIGHSRTTSRQRGGKIFIRIILTTRKSAKNLRDRTAAITTTKNRCNPDNQELKALWGSLINHKGIS